MSVDLTQPNPTMNRQFLDDVVSIKVAETETVLEDKQRELEEQLKAQNKACEKAVKALNAQKKADAEKQVGTKLKAIADAFNASELFPEMEYFVGSSYDVRTTTNEEVVDEEEEKPEKPTEYGVPVEIAVKRNEKADKIARGGLPLTTTTQGTTRSGLKIIAATTAIVQITDEVTELMGVVDQENKKRAKLQDQIEKIKQYLRNMGSSERKIRAAVARNHLGISDEGQKALQFLESIGLPQTLGKDIQKALPELVEQK